MKKIIIATIILFVTAIVVTVVYFKNLDRSGPRTRETMLSIPQNAALILEINNDKGFYDIFNDSQLFTSIVGRQTLDELDTLRKQLLLNPHLKPFFSEQNIFISLHPLQNNTVELLLTASVNSKFKPTALEDLAKDKNTGLLISPILIAGKKCYTIYSNIIKKRFYLLYGEDGIFSGSFSNELITQRAQYEPNKHKQAFVLLPDQQNSNSLANLYINYSQLQPLFDQLFKNKNTDIFKSFKSLPALAALTLNFKSNALMFNGFSQIETNQPTGYLNLFLNQQPVTNQLKDIFPSTTAYSINFAVADPQQFKSDLSDYQVKTGLQHEKDSLFNKVKTETGINFINEFNQVLGNEFAVVTTRYEEKFAIILLKNGSKLKNIMYNIASMSNENIGQLNYSKLPYFLLGDPFSFLNHPWFMIVDNYLILANSATELNSYYDSYINRKFQSKLQQYKDFDNLRTERSNISWYMNVKAMQSLFKRDLSENFYNAYETNTPGWKNFYAVSFQLTASNKKFYTNVCMKLDEADSTAVK
ncbi:MAG: hypothetical protein ABI367_15920 [Mucilaginibacter sp.]